MSNSFIDSIAKAVAEGKTKSQFAVPDGTYPGDLFFITASDHKIAVVLWWDGITWQTEHAVFSAELPVMKGV